MWQWGRPHAVWSDRVRRAVQCSLRGPRERSLLFLGLSHPLPRGKLHARYLSRLFGVAKKKKKKSIAICFRTSVSCLSFLVYTKDIYQVSSKFHLFCFSFTTGFVGPSERQGTLQWLLVFIKEFMQSVSSRLTCLILPKNPADSWFR